VDDLIQARLLEPVYVNGQVALPLGTLVDGRITSIRSARRLNRPAELLLRFERVTLPNGQAEPIRAELAAFDNPGPPKSRLDSEGHLKGTRAFSWKVFVGGFAALGTLVAAKASFASSAALAPWAPAGGAALLTYAFVWPRGNDVHLPPQTRCRIRLNLPLTVRVQW
jgi:hypothetical protein